MPEIHDLQKNDIKNLNSGENVQKVINKKNNTTNYCTIAIKVHLKRYWEKFLSFCNVGKIAIFRI